uniref:SCP domain-containing protein n=1 Tax=Haemonchus contortus TaxID=6289 RepID=A0A6F7PAD5_HAECO
MHHIQMLYLIATVALLVTIFSVKGSETLLDEKETFKTLNSMYTNDLVWSDEWAQKALDWLNSPEQRDSINADMAVGGRGLIVNASDKAVWQKILDVLEINFDEKESELDSLPAGTLYGCNGYMSTRSTEDDYVSAVCLYKRQ